MNLADMLGYADIGQLSRIAVEYQCECNGNSKNELIQTILSAVSRREIFEEQVGRLGLEDLRFLNSLLFDTRTSFSMEDLTARIQQSKFGEDLTKPASSTAEGQPTESKGTSKAKSSQATKKRSKASNPVKEVTPRDIILKFKHQGWLFNGLAGPNRYMFHVPADLKTRLRDTLERKMSILVEAAEEPNAYRDEQGLLSEDLYHMLQYVQRYEVPTSTDGSMYKRNLQQLIEHMGVRESLPQKGEWRFGYGRKFHVYPNRLALLYDYATDSKLLVEATERLTLTQAGEDKLSEEQLDETAKLYRYWLRLYKNPIPNLLALVNWIDRLARNWVTAESLQRTLLPYVKPYYYDTSESVFAQRIVAMMLHLGLVRIGEHERYGTVIRMTKLGSAVIGNAFKEEAVRSNR
ncbi:hypothetical protein DFQ01_10492 [Paenibacillus cellulosilyticus]|uniref:Uncharacterized protein n=1 Tax=Paenibacillus cellulosilyticus TaxID=375489 RepID=A0A2V2YW79_9BACL|nr:hypothetical protein [Paenibacillus cellulosilyticus]PWW05532.1 hypothetical protein DFQ01_10492 [Paenibacillus cellulosilyticus]QKS45431.1 hypothetical protein HUB94_14120 [Paenibacillus cellulosilyticus]